MRKYFAAVLLLLVSAPLVLSLQKSGEWIKYRSPEGRYSVSLPAQPKLTTQEATAADGQKFPQYMASVIEPGDVAFIIGYFDSVPGTIFLVEAARNEIVKRINGTLISESAISLSGYPGREFKIMTKPAPVKPAAIAYVVRARLYEVDKRVYFLQFIFPQSLESDALAVKALRYFDSFQLEEPSPL